MSKHALSTLALAAGAMLAVQPSYAQEEQTAPAAAAPATAPDTQTMLKKANELIDLLQCIENKEEADLLAPEIKRRWEEFSALLDKLDTAIPHELLEADMVLSQTIAELDYMNDWFGSKALKSVFMVDDDADMPGATVEPPTTPEQHAAYSAAVRSMITSATVATATLRSIHDKDSADAAAPHLSSVLKGFVGTAEELRSRGDYSPAIARALKAEFPDAEKILYDFSQAVIEVQDADYFDSEALARALEILVN